MATALAAGTEHLPTTSLAGRTLEPATLSGETRIGGFGGARQFQRYIEEGGFAAVIDATHPFAKRISRNARRAALVAKVPRLRLWRPAWQAVAGDHWHAVDDDEAVVDAARGLGRRPFVTLGRSGPKAFPSAAFERVTFRSIEWPGELAWNALWVQSRPPFTVEGELKRLAAADADVVVTKNSGGTATTAKLEAARLRGLPVVMLKRPQPPHGPLASSVDEALSWLAQLSPASLQT